MGSTPLLYGPAPELPYIRRQPLSYRRREAPLMLWGRRECSWRDGNALQAAAHFGDKQSVHVLLDARADVNAQGDYYDNVLHAAARYSRLELVQILLDAGVDVSAQGGVYANALASAKQRGHETVAEVLRKASRK